MDICEEEATPKKSGVATTSSMLQVHVKVPSPPRRKTDRSSSLPPLTASINVSRLNTDM